MRLQTKNFGDIDYEESRVITFPHGLPGFPDDKRYLLIPESDPPELFYWLQSVDDGDVAFTLMDVYPVLPDYNPLVEPDEMEELGGFSESAGLEVYNIAVIPDDAANMRVNLKAPIVINMEAGLGKQVIVSNDNYPVRFMIAEALKARGNPDSR